MQRDLKVFSTILISCKKATGVAAKVETQSNAVAARLVCKVPRFMIAIETKNKRPEANVLPNSFLRHRLVSSV